MIPTNFSEVDALYRQIVADGARRLVVASAGSGDGATTAAYALARRASRGGRSVLLVDLNLHRPSLDQLLGLDRVTWSPDDPKSVDAGIARFGADGMAALPAPSDDSVPVAFRETATLSAFFDRLAERFDLVIVDIAPIRVRNARNIPPLTVCRAVGTVLFAVMMRKTSEAEAVEAIEMIETEGARILGAVVSDRDNPSLGEELEREAARLTRLSPGLVGWLQRRIRSLPLIHQLP